MCYRNRKEEQKSVLKLLKKRLIKDQINIEDIKSITLVDKEGTVWFQGFEDEFMILEKDNKTFLSEAAFHAKNENLWFLFKHGKLYKSIVKKDYTDLILLCYQTMLETVEQAKLIGARVIVEKVYNTELDYWNDDPWKTLFKNDFK